MKKLVILLALLLFAVSQGAFAQKAITGKVINAEDGLAMPGVSVVVKGTTTGMATDNNGIFTLNVSNDAIIVLSFMGFKTVEILVENQTQFDVTLQPDVNVLGDVVVRGDRNRVIPPERAVVTAMGVVRDKIKLTYAIQSISGNELIKAPVHEDNFWVNLNGKAAGVNVSAGGIQIRGPISWSMEQGANAPLVVVDGVPMGRYVSYNFMWLSSEMIEDITILKSANAAMLYGSEAVNGAIVITLKK